MTSRWRFGSLDYKLLNSDLTNNKIYSLPIHNLRNSGNNHENYLQKPHSKRLQFIFYTFKVFNLKIMLLKMKDIKYVEHIATDFGHFEIFSKIV